MPPIAETETKEQTYWVATLPNCPIEQLTIEGVCFPRRTMIRKEVRGMSRIVGERAGGIVKLTPEKAAKVRAKIEHMVARWRGKPNEFCAYGTKGDVLDLEELIPVFSQQNNKQETPDPKTHPRANQRREGDIPLAECVQMKLVESNADAPQFFEADLTALAGATIPGSPEPLPTNVAAHADSVRKGGRRRRDGEVVEIPSSSSLTDPGV
jgi:hypothetical protein